MACAMRSGETKLASYNENATATAKYKPTLQLWHEVIPRGQSSK